MKDLLTTIGRCLLLTLFVVSSSMGEAVDLNAQTVAPGGNLKGFRIHRSASALFSSRANDFGIYVGSDTLKDPVTIWLASASGLDEAAYSLSGNGVATVAVTSASFNAWNLPIDYVTLNAATAALEPASLLLLSTPTVQGD